MILRGLITALLASVLLVPAVGARAAEPTEIDVPEGVWSGVMTVTFTDSSEDVKSFVVRITNAGGAGSVTAREPNSTPGEPVEVDVPTWGHHGSWRVETGTCDTVSDPCATSQVVPRQFAQDPADVVTTDFELPDEPVLLPEEADAARITLHSPGGNHFLIRRAAHDASLSRLLPTGVSTPIPFPGLRGATDVSLEVARCPEGTTNPALTRIEIACEVFDLDRTVTVLRDLDLGVDTSSSGVIVDPTDGTSVEINAVRRANVGESLSYELIDASGQTIVGPVDFGGGSTAVFDPNAVDVSIPDGDYTLKVTARFTKGDLERVEISEVPLAVTDNPPPPDDLPDYSDDRIDRDVRGDKAAYVSVTGTNDPDIIGTLHITDASGEEVWKGSTGPDCRGDTCQMNPNPNEYAWYDFFWPGTTTDGGALPAGEYHAAMTVVDGWGRSVEVYDAGSLYINHLETVTTTERQRAADTTYALSTIGRCSSSPKPGPHKWPGSVGMLSLTKCTSTAGQADWAFRSFLLGGKSDAPERQRLISYRVRAYGAPMKRGMVGGIVYDVSTGAAGTMWRSKGALRGGLGWHQAARHVVPVGSQNGERAYSALVQARTTEGNRWDIKFWEVDWTYRAWQR